MSKEPYAVARSNQKTGRSLLSALAIWIVCQIILQFPRCPRDPGNPAFWIYVSTDPLSMKTLVRWFAIILNRIFPSTISRDIGNNWLRRKANSSLGIYTPSVLAQTSRTTSFLQATLSSFHRRPYTPGQALYTL